MQLKSTYILILICIFCCISTVCSARDSGDEASIPVIKWQCELCNLVVFTFDSDDLSAQSSLQNKDVQYQQSNWRLLREYSRSIPKCSRMDGAHLFRKTQNFMTSGAKIAEHLQNYIVIRNGRSVRVNLQHIKCHQCGLEANCFAGDDLDSYDSIRLTEKLHLRYMHDKSQVRACRGKLPTERECLAHIFLLKNRFTPSSSYAIAEHLRQLIYSD